jgi:chromosomal replication initiation ATPase DnaA
MVAKIDAPDDAVLEGVMHKFFRERNIKPANDVFPYLIHRIERSIPALIDVVKRIDELADAERREVNRTLARHILENEDRTRDLFE